MARRPTDEMARLNLSVPRGINGYWAVIRKLDDRGHWSVPDINVRCYSDRASIKDFVLRLVRGGIAKRVGFIPQKGTDTSLYRLVERPAEAPRLDRQGNALPEPTIEILWRTMKMAKTFTAAELTDLASAGDRQVSKASVDRYIRHLKKAGVLAALASRKGAPVRYRLARNLGAKAPIILKTLSLYDPNAGEILIEIETSEVSS